MMRVDKRKKCAARLANTTLVSAGLQECDLQSIIANSFDDFCKEIGEELMLVARECSPCDHIGDRLDILALDGEGAAVVIELKRNDNKLQLLQALTYAAMIGQWDPTKFHELLMQSYRMDAEQARNRLDEFVKDGADQINQLQRIILIAEQFDYTVLATAEWLHENYELDIRCYKVAMGGDKDSLYLSCSLILPATGIREQAVRRGRRVGTTRKYGTWEEVLASVENQALCEFIKKEVAAGQESRLGADPAVVYRVKGSRRFWLNPRQGFAYIWQDGRFDEDEVFWTKKLGGNCRMNVVNGGNSISLNLETTKHFAAFKKAMGELKDVEFEYR